MRSAVLVSAFLFAIRSANAQCATDICGYWYCDNYNSGVPVEYLAIDMVDGRWVCTKILGDAFVPTGHITWQGIPSACQFSGEVFGTAGLGMPINPIPATIQILSEDHIRVVPFGLEFFRSTVEHLEFVGVDRTRYPVSCIGCDSPIPNVFTPNGDGINDLLQLVCGGPSIKFAITDRWGLTMFETSDPRPIWDGRNGWTPCPTGIYYWSMIVADDRTGILRRGAVHLFR